MTYTAPATPVAGTAITVAFYGTNIRDNIIHLRALLPDASAASQILVSSSNTVAAWSSSPSITSLTIAGGNLGFGSGRKIAFASESAEKILLDQSNSSIGTATNQVYIRTPLNMEFRDNGGTARVNIVVSATPSMTIGSDTVLTTATPLNYVPLAGGTMTGALVFSGIDGTNAAPLVQLNATGLGIYKSATDEMGFASASTGRGKVQAGGTLFWDGTVSGGDIIDRSDERIKRDIRQVKALDFGAMRSIKPIEYGLRGDQHKDRARQVGFSAQDMQAAVPWAVVEQENDGRPELGISLGAMDAALMMYCQDLDERLSAIEHQ